MVTKYTNWIIQLLLEEHVILEQERELYYYCFQTIIFQSMVYGTIMLIAILNETVLITLAYYLGFLSVRYTAGGFHTNSHKACFILSIVVYLISIFILGKIPVCHQLSFFKFCVIGAIIMIFLVAPVDHKNHTFLLQEKVRHKKQSRFVIMILVAISFITLKISVEISMAIAVGLFCAASSVVIGKIQRSRELC